jgi:hypothetical protein
MNNRREFIKKSAIAGIGLSGLAITDIHLFDQKDDTGDGLHEGDQEKAAGDNSDQNNNFTTSDIPVELNYMEISVKETAGLNLLRPVTGGVPLAEGVAPAGSRFILLDKNKKSIPCQSEILTRWKDNSARWVLLDFQADPPANGTDNFRLKWDTNSRETQPSQPVKTGKGTAITAGSGTIQLSAVPGAILRISKRVDVKLVMTDREGKRCEGVVESVKVETAGKLRSTLAFAGSFRTPEGQKVVDFRLRASVFAGLSQVYLEPQILINSDKDMIQYINDLSIEFVPLNPIRSAAIGGAPGWNGFPNETSDVRLLQIDDENYRIEGTPDSGKQAPGWLEMNDGKGNMAVTLRDFWQQWPKSLEVNLEIARLGLLPAFEAGTFAHMGPWYKHDYLFEGNSYRLREGQTRRWQVWFDLSGNGDILSKSVNKHLVPAVDPVQAIATGEWGFVASAGSQGMTEYDRWADNLFESYCRAIREQRDYGAMNWGDWWGERNCNWGNHEYDTPLHIFTQFARTGDPKYFYVAEQAARHFSEVDVVHFLNPELKNYFSQWESEAYPSRPGMVHEHSIGHVGGFHPVGKIRELYLELNVGDTKTPYLCLDPFNLGHIFTLGMAQYYLLTGDPWIKETVERIGENLMRLTEDGKFQFKGRNHVGRENGWTMLALAGVYKINPSERCLKAMQRIADDALDEQNANCGGWLYTLSWGHCNCISPMHVGEAGFISSIRLNGLSYYYRLTGDNRIPGSVNRGITHLNNDTWIDQKSDWRYTSCPATVPIGQSGVTIMALVNSVSLNDNMEHLRILQKAWDTKFTRLLKVPATAPGLGKSYSTIMYGSPEAMNLFVKKSKGK